MAHLGQCEHNHPPFVINRVPDAARTRYLELPLLERPSADQTRPEVALQRVLTLAPAARVRAKARPRGASRARSLLG